MLPSYEFQQRLFRALGIRVGLRIEVAKFRVGLIVASLLMNSVLACAGVFRVEAPLPEKSATVLSSLMSSLGAVKLLVVCRERTAVTELLTQCSGSRGNAPLLQVERTADFFNNCFFVATIFVVLFWSVPGLFQPIPSLPFPYWIPFPTDTPANFFLAYAGIVVVLVIIGVANVCIDTALLTIAARICYRMSHLCRAFVLLNDRGKDDGTELKMAIKECAKEHVKIRRLIGLLENILSPIFFFQVIEFTMISCMTVFAITKVDDTVFEFLKFLPMLTGGYVMFYMYCWLGEQIAMHSEDLNFAIYCCQWYTFSISDRQSILIMQTFADRTLVLRGSYIFTMSLNTFQTAVRESFSYFMVLHSLTG